MSSSKEKQDNNASAVALQLFQTQSLMQTLLSEIRENSTLTANVNADMRNLRLNVDSLHNIIRGGDGNNRPLVLEVEMMKHADIHLDKRVTAIVEDVDDQVLSLAKNVAEAVGRMEAIKKDIEAKFELIDKQRRDLETAKLNAEVEVGKDIRLDGRTRFATWATIIIAALSLTGTIVALVVK